MAIYTDFCMKKEVKILASEAIIKQKEESVKKLAEELKDAKLILLTEYRGITVEDDTKLRKTVRTPSDMEGVRFPQRKRLPGMWHEETDKMRNRGSPNEHIFTSSRRDGLEPRETHSGTHGYTDE